MSTIAEVRLHRRTVALVRPFVTAVRTATSIDAMLIEVVDSDGRSGWGEAPTSWRVTGESPASVSAAVEGPLRVAVLGLPVDDPAGASLALDRAIVRNSAARMGVDCAIYDLAAQQTGVPLHVLLGASAAEVRTDMTLSAVSDAAGIDALVETAARHRDAGFHTLKLKVGAGTDDVAAMRAVRDAVGPDTTLRADANQAWMPEQAVGIIRQWEDLGLAVQLIEQPVHRDDLDGLAFVTAHVDTPVLADESVWTTRDASEVIARRAADLINIKLAKTGGIREALRVRDLATSAGIATIVGCMMESHVGIAAAAAVAAAVSAGATGADAVGDGSAAGMAHDLDAGLWMSESPVRGGIRYDGEIVTMSDELGLGIGGLTPLVE